MQASPALLVLGVGLAFAVSVSVVTGRDHRNRLPRPVARDHFFELAKALAKAVTRLGKAAWAEHEGR